jgi:hypothetical protein
VNRASGSISREEGVITLTNISIRGKTCPITFSRLTAALFAGVFKW